MPAWASAAGPALELSTRPSCCSHGRVSTTFLSLSQPNPSSLGPRFQGGCNRLAVLLAGYSHWKLLPGLWAPTLHFYSKCTITKNIFMAPSRNTSQAVAGSTVDTVTSGRSLYCSVTITICSIPIVCLGPIDQALFSISTVSQGRGYTSHLTDEETEVQQWWGT